ASVPSLHGLLERAGPLVNVLDRPAAQLALGSFTPLTRHVQRVQHLVRRCLNVLVLKVWQVPPYLPPGRSCPRAGWRSARSKRSAASCTATISSCWAVCR